MGCGGEIERSRPGTARAALWHDAKRAHRENGAQAATSWSSVFNYTAITDDNLACRDLVMMVVNLLDGADAWLREGTIGAHVDAGFAGPVGPFA